MMTSFRVRSAPELETLFLDLVSVMEAEPLSPLETEVIVVAQNTGLRSWLEVELARRMGCAASLHMPSPRGLSAELMRRLLPELRQLKGSAVEGFVHPFEVESLTWRVADLLPRFLGDHRFALVAQYLVAADDRSRRLVTLSARIAQHFEDYQIYRPDLLFAWERGEDPLPEWQHGRWQAELWRQLVAGTSFPSRARELELLVERLSRLERPMGLPRRVSVFGARIFPPAYLRVLHALAGWIPVTFYTVAPVERLESPPENLLLSRLGDQWPEFHEMLRALDGPPIEHCWLGSAGTSGAGSLLQGLQQAVRANADTAPGVRGAEALLDGSVTVHDCHSPLREVEVLRDQLLHAFETIPGLRPHDVLVLVPDIPTYAPLLDAVFGVAAGAPALPYRVLGHPRGEARLVIEAFERVLYLMESRLGAREVLEMLDFPVVRQAAQITEDEIPILTRWVCDTNVCWGSDAEQRVALGFPNDASHTWDHGFDRLLLGYMMGEVDDVILDAVPLESVGADRGDLLGRFSAWAHAVFDAVSEAGVERTLAEWSEWLEQRIEAFFRASPGDETEVLLHIRDQVRLLAHLPIDPEAGARRVGLGAVRAQLHEVLGAYAAEERAITGRITISDFQTLQHAPFRVIVLLGQSDASFPGSADRADLDAQSQERRPGDRDTRSTNKQLFLDAVLATRERLIVTYVGRSVRDNAEQAHATTLDALLEACGRLVGEPVSVVQEQLVVRHRLQPFATEYFDGRDERLFSYTASHCVQRDDSATSRSAVPFIKRPLKVQQTDTQTLTLEGLCDAWSQPSRYFARRLGVRLDESVDEPRSDSPIRLDRLEAYKLKQRILEQLLRGTEEDAIYAWLRGSGSLPAGELGRAWFTHLLDLVKPIVQLVQRHGPPQRVDLSVVGSGWTLTGHISHLSEDGALHYRPAKVKPKDQVTAWIRHLALCADGRAGSGTRLFGEDTAYLLRPLAPQDALGVLEQLVAELPEFLREPAPLFDQASAAAVVVKDEEVQVDLEKGRRAFQSGYNRPGDDIDAYVALCNRGRDPFADPARFESLARTLWVPLLAYRVEGA
jgi:exodeoxyribonuclease V gamma subunit